MWKNKCWLRNEKKTLNSGEIITKRGSLLKTVDAYPNQLEFNSDSGPLQKESNSIPRCDCSKFQCLIHLPQTEEWLNREYKLLIHSLVGKERRSISSHSQLHLLNSRSLPRSSQVSLSAPWHGNFLKAINWDNSRAQLLHFPFLSYYCQLFLTSSILKTIISYILFCFVCLF